MIQTHKPRGKSFGLKAARLCLVALLMYTAPASAKTWRILAVRVSFPVETPDEETTSGNGTFDLRTLSEVRDSLAYPFDAPPHNRTYFEAHLQALSNYYREVSSGQVDIQFDVYPREANGSYVLSTPLIDYGNGRTRQEIAERITRLFRDGIRLADQNESSLNFSQYDVFAVFHAGLGGEASQALNDIPSAFISNHDLSEFADGAIPVDNGASTITSGMLLPEAISANGRGGLNGTLARFFASQLGLPGLSDFENDLPAVGDWSLMDTGANNLIEADRFGLQPLRTGEGNALIGFLPSRPMAWSRIHLGWISPLEITRNDTVQLVAPHVKQSNLPQAVKVPISATEYFLLENRISRLSVHNRIPNIQLSQPNGVWLSSDDYDAQIPGSGILIWHIDNTVINASSETKTINSNPDFEIAFAQYRRGISLEEADGLEDIGNVSANRVIQSGIISFDAIEGGPKDPFYVGNNTVFGPGTNPNTSSNLHYPTGITIEVLSPPSDTMTVAIRFSQQQDNWPVANLPLTPRQIPRTADLNNDGQFEIFNNTLWTLSGKSSPIELNAQLDFPPAIRTLQSLSGIEWIAGHGSVQYRWQNDTLDSLVTTFVTATNLSAPPVIANFPDASVDIWGWSDGRVQWGVWNTLYAGGITIGSSVQSLAVGNITPDADNELVAITKNGQVHLIHNNNQSTQLASFAPLTLSTPAIADLDRDGDDDIAVTTSEGQLLIIGHTGILYQSDPVPGGATSSPVLADLDNDGYIEVLFGGNGKLWIFRFNGILQTGGVLSFPIKDSAGPIDAPPVLADLDKDGNTDILVGSHGGLIYGFSSTGKQMPGFPISISGPIQTSPLIDDLDKDGTLELVVFTTNGVMQLFHIEKIDSSYKGNKVVWGQLGGGPGNSGHLLQVPANQPATPSGDLLPQKSVYVYPNPIRNGDKTHIRFFVSEISTITVTIYNPIGEQVDQLTHTNPVPNTDNEIAWDVTDYASGLYICRVEASTGSKKEVRFIKAAVIK